MKYIFLIATMTPFAFIYIIILPYIVLFSEMYDNKHDCYLSEKALERQRVRDNSFLRKVIPLKEGEFTTKILKIGGYRYFLYIRAVPLFIYSIFLLIVLPMAIVNCFYSFIPENIMNLAPYLVLLTAFYEVIVIIYTHLA